MQGWGCARHAGIYRGRRGVGHAGIYRGRVGAEHAGMHPDGTARGMPGYTEAGGAGRGLTRGWCRSHTGAAVAGPCPGLRVSLLSRGPWCCSTYRRHRPGGARPLGPQRGVCLGSTGTGGVSVAGASPGPPPVLGCPQAGGTGAPAVPRDPLLSSAGSLLYLRTLRPPGREGFTSWGSGLLSPRV